MDRRRLPAGCTRKRLIKHAKHSKTSDDVWFGKRSGGQCSVYRGIATAANQMAKCAVACLGCCAPRSLGPTRASTAGSRHPCWYRQTLAGRNASSRHTVMRADTETLRNPGYRITTLRNLRHRIALELVAEIGLPQPCLLSSTRMEGVRKSWGYADRKPPWGI